ncbi:TetR family transcriptional regulator [Mycobacterium sp. IS-1742]|uniref:TetR/AcrR family transcriptional regulator n=1 Tax=Mycobacterium sp. IS-1742 TaxID=1772285 RepID=UPI0007404A97|nr:TetR/AcrR family transcriptional regulator [Mycobacterium sp. IS-1742]KUI24710.1 TetR family transcriptional regulator [Mycobacterium sp. IS-1742]
MRSATDRRPAQRSDLRRDAILDALDRWLQQSSVETVNIAEVAQQAGLTRSAFYFYFENKAAAVAALTERILDETLAVNKALTVGPGSPRVRVHAMLTGLFDLCERHRHLFQAMLEVRGSSPAVRSIWDDARESFVDSIAEMIRAERAAGVAPDGVDARVLATVLIEFNDRMLERLALGGPLPADRLRQGAAAVWLSSVYGITDPEEHPET